MGFMHELGCMRRSRRAAPRRIEWLTAAAGPGRAVWPAACGQVWMIDGRAESYINAQR